MINTNEKGTPFDDVFKTLLEKCRKLIIPVINEVFGTDYEMSEEINLLTNEFHYISEEGKSEKRIADSCIRIRDKLYHIECQSRVDSFMEIRMIEYDFLIALSDVEEYTNRHVINFPESAVIYLRYNHNTPDEFRIILNLPGGNKAEYAIPVVKVLKYSKEELFDRNLLFFIPYYILRFEDRLVEINNDFLKLNEFGAEYREIYDRLIELNKKKIIDMNYLQNLLQLIRYLVVIVADKAENVRKEVDVMRGKVLRFETDDIWDEALEKGLEKGREKGREEGREEGEVLKVISLIRIKVLKNKPPQTIADELEEDIVFVNNVIHVLSENEGLSDDAVYNRLNSEGKVQVKL